MVDITTALVTDGESPVIMAYIHSNTIVATMPWVRIFNRLRGHSAMETNKHITPTCSPLNAKMCANPAVVNISRVSLLKSELSPVTTVLRNSFVGVEMLLENISREILSRIRFMEYINPLASVTLIMQSGFITDLYRIP